MDSEKQDKILDAALEVFLRYGFKKATMGDIAAKAEISRPSVYVAFSNKEEIFRAVIVRKLDDSFEEAKEKVSQCTHLEAKIAAILEVWILEPYKMIHSSSEPEDLMNFVYTFATDLQRRMLDMLEEQLTEIIRADPGTNPDFLAKAGLGIEIVARLIAVSTADLKQSARDVEELEKLLEAIVRIHTSVLMGQCSQNVGDEAGKHSV